MPDFKEKLLKLLSDPSQQVTREPDNRQRARQEKKEQAGLKKERIAAEKAEIRELERIRAESGLNEYLVQVKSMTFGYRWNVNYEYAYPDGTNRERAGVSYLSVSFTLPRTVTRSELGRVLIIVMKNGDISIRGRDSIELKRDNWRTNRELVGDSLLEAIKNPGLLPQPTDYDIGRNMGAGNGPF